MKKKFTFKAIYVLLIINSLFSIPTFAKTKPAKSIPGTAIFVMAELPNVQIKEKIFKVSKPHVFLSLTIPQFSGLEDKQFEKMLNKKLLKEANSNKDSFLATVKAYQKDISDDQLSPIMFEYRESFTPIPSIPPYLVLERFKYQYSGGAHGDTEYQYIVLDTIHSKEVTLDQLFKANVNYQMILNDKIKQMIIAKQEQGAFFFTGSDGFQSIKENQPFFINKSGDLVIVFNIYEIAPYAAGAQYFTIPRSELAPYLK